MSETAVERRLREMAELGVPSGYEGELTDADKAALDAGREAIALLRRYRDGDDDGRFVKHVAALLARCEGEK